MFLQLLKDYLRNKTFDKGSTRMNKKGINQKGQIFDQ